MKCKQLGLRVLSTAAIMSIISSIAAPAFADIYYIGNGSIDVITKTDDNGTQYVEVNQNGNTYKDYSDEIVIKDGTSESDATLKEADRVKEKQSVDARKNLPTDNTTETTTIGESEPVPQEQTTEEVTPAEEEPEEEQEQPAAEKTEETEADPDAELEETVTEEEPEASADEDASEETEKEDAPPAPQITDDDTPLSAPVNDAEPVDAQSDEETTPAEGSVEKPTNNVIRIINDWVDKVLNIRLSNVNIKANYSSTYADGTKPNHQGEDSGYAAAATVKAAAESQTKLELDGQNLTDSQNISATAGLNKQGKGWLTITDETDDQGEKITAKKAEDDKSGSLGAYGGSGNGAAGIGGNCGKDANNIIIEGYATIDANGGGSTGAGIGGGGGTSRGNAGDAHNIWIQGNSTVSVKYRDGAGIGGGSAYGTESRYTGGSATGIKIRDHATVIAKNRGARGASGSGSAIGSAGYTGEDVKVDITIGTEGATSETEDVHVIVDSLYGSGIGLGGMIGSGSNAKVTIQGNSTIEASEKEKGYDSSWGIKATDLTIRDKALIKISSVTRHINIKGTAALIGSSKTPNDGGLINTIGDDNEIRYTNSKSNDTLVKIVHGKNKCVWDAGTVTKPATCSSTGTKTHKCIYETSNSAITPCCDRTWEEEIPMIAHTLDDLKNDENKIHHDATCVKGGYWEGTCKNCGQTVEVPDGTEPDSTKHDYDGQEWITDKDSTCTTEGTKHQECKNAPGNEEHYNQGTIAKKDHVAADDKVNVKEATETEPGYTGDTVCKDCGATIEQGETTPKLEHKWENVGEHVGATCTTDGYQDQKCTNDGCDATQRVWDHPEDAEHKGDGKSHNYDDQEWVEVKKGTCTDEGEAIRKCNNAPDDKTHYDHKNTDKVPSNHGDHTTRIEGAKEATCEQPGYTGDEVCDGCGEVVKKGEEIPATGHDTEIVGKKDPTATEPGYTGDEVCKDCGETVKQGEVIPALGLPDDDNKGNTTVTEAAAPELWVTAPDTIRQVFHVTQNGTVRTYESPYNSGTLTGTMEILQYLQEQGVETIVFTTNQRTSRFAVADLLALVGEGDVFYLTHSDASEPTLLVVTNDHTDLLG